MRRLLPLALLAIAGCGYPYPPPPLPEAGPPQTDAARPVSRTPAIGGVSSEAAGAPVAEVRAPVTILVSIDGFRPDYLDQGVTPNLVALAANGVSALMRPSFPSKTFPNHWTLVTGLYPDHHGIVANTMEDAARPDATFTMATDDPFWWNAAEPIWVTSETSRTGGGRSATMFWPGSNVAWGGARQGGTGHPAVVGGRRPSDWQQYNQAISGYQRVDTVVDWLRRPALTRPRFVALYFDQVDTAGHAFGPDAPETRHAAAEVDMLIGSLVKELEFLHQPANLVIVSDHGMAATSSERTIALDALAPPAEYRVEETGPYASLYPAPGETTAVDHALLGRHGHMACWRKRDIPARFHYGTNPRIPPILCLADPGWLVVQTAPTKRETGGNHGYDNFAPDMAALFIANGPAFVRGKRLASFNNVDVAPLLRDLLDLPPGDGLDGDDAPFRSVLTTRR